MFSGRLSGGRLYAGRLFRRAVVVQHQADVLPGGIVHPGRKSRLRYPAHAGIRLSLGCTVASTAGLRIGASAAVDAVAGIYSHASLRLTGVLETGVVTSVKAEADMRDVVLEMLLLAD